MKVKEYYNGLLIVESKQEAKRMLKQAGTSVVIFNGTGIKKVPKAKYIREVLDTGDDKFTNCGSNYTFALFDEKRKIMTCELGLY